MNAIDLILLRHGDTFNKGDKVVWVGSRNDLPLTKNGIEQAKNAAKYLKIINQIPKKIYCGPLKRTREFASIIISELGLTLLPTADEALNEIDYGDWSGLTDEEIIEKFGKDSFSGWDEKGIWPQTGNWGSSDEQTVKSTRSFVEKVKEDGISPVLAITSNGKLRYFSKIAGDVANKVKTGHLCQLQLNEGKIEKKLWNVSC